MNVGKKGRWFFIVFCSKYIHSIKKKKSFTTRELDEKTQYVFFAHLLLWVFSNATASLIFFKNIFYCRWWNYFCSVKCVWRLELNILSPNKQHIQDLSQSRSFKINDKTHRTQHVKSNDGDRSSHRGRSQDCGGLHSFQAPFSLLVWEEQLTTMHARVGGMWNWGSYYLLSKSKRFYFFLLFSWDTNKLFFPL